MGVYHAGSRAVQDRLGVRDQADHVGRSMGDTLKPVAAAFLELQPMLVLGAADRDGGGVWASVLTGEPGFVHALDPRRIAVDVGVAVTDPLAPALAVEGARVGTIALDPRTRRRMRLVGRSWPTPRGLAIEAERVFSNCPRHLQKRESYEWVADRIPEEPRRGTELTCSQQEFIAAADTFLLATVHADGVDVSHRGGNPGFVRVESPRELAWRDYPGNSMFLTLGNLLGDPRAGVLFLDWTTGTTLHLTGEARTEFAADGERTVRFTVTEAVRTPAAVPLRWSPPEYSPANPDPTR
ncbi:pyridoxamine 5'-phosphate oxidase family protein [Streptomyces sp. NPDC047022]|uniref:pyridoxamine 5'-phosphate oxidase family protein n=1 Tax=Streptomyces sp. NPDC047022 TaxID=3155737 RepID=UPI0033F8B61F